MALKGYSSYRGRGAKWKILLAVVLVLIILCAAAVMFLQDRIVYDDTGNPHLQLPGAGQTDSSDAPVDVDLIIDGGEADEQPQSTGEVRRILSVPAGELTAESWSAAQMRMDETVTAVEVTLKDEQGWVYFNSVAALPGAVKVSEETAQVLQEITVAETHSVARICCFLDPKVANYYVTDRGLRNTSGYIFYDGNNTQWLDPAKENARNYLCAMIREAAELGFDEILLTCVGYPTEGQLEKIAYGDADRPEMLKLFMQEARAAAGKSKLSLELTAQLISSGRDEAAGQVLDQLAPLTECIYAQTSQPQIQRLSEALEKAAPNTAFIPELTAAPQEGSWLLLTE